jgi:hypothetical protein
MDTASRPRASRRRLDAFLDRWATLNIEMDEDAKVPMKPLSLATVNSRFPGTLGSLVERQKICMNCILTHCYLRTGKLLLGKTWEIWAWNVLGYCKD